MLAMITSQNNPDWPLDTKISGNRKAGLTAPSKVRMKLFTLDNRLIVRKIGTLTDTDKKAVAKALQRLLATRMDAGKGTSSPQAGGVLKNVIKNVSCVLTLSLESK